MFYPLTGLGTWAKEAGFWMKLSSPWLKTVRASLGLEWCWCWWLGIFWLWEFKLFCGAGKNWGLCCCGLWFTAFGGPLGLWGLWIMLLRISGNFGNLTFERKLNIWNCSDLTLSSSITGSSPTIASLTVNLFFFGISVNKNSFISSYCVQIFIWCRYLMETWDCCLYELE